MNNRRSASYGRSIFIKNNPLKLEGTALGVLAERGVISLAKHGKNYFYIAHYKWELPESRGYFFYIAKSPRPTENVIYGTQYFVPTSEKDCQERKWFSCQTGEQIPADDLTIRGQDAIGMFVSATERKALALIRKFPHWKMTLSQAVEKLAEMERTAEARKKKYPRTAGSSPKDIAHSKRIADIEQKKTELAAAEIDRV